MATPILTEDRKNAVLKVIEKGGSREEAAAKIGCHERTIRNAAARDDEFARQLEIAQLSVEDRVRAQMIAMAESGKNFHAAKWVLERMYPHTYAQRKPGMVTMKQVEELLGNLCDILTQYVDSPQERVKIQQALTEMLRSSGYYEPWELEKRST